jgi:hypothetical protein
MQSVCPTYPPTSLDRSTSTRCPCFNTPNARQISAYRRATVVLPVPGLPVKTRCNATSGEEVLAQNPFPDVPGNRAVAIFLDEVTSPAVFDNVMGRADDEELRLGRREIYVRYGFGMAASKLRIPAATKGTARNMNTVAKLVAMAATDV